MLRLTDLESLLKLQLIEHQKLLRHLDAQTAAMKAFDLKAMDVAAGLQEGSRLRIATLEHKRKTFMLALTRQHRLDPDIKISELAKLDPQRGPALLALRDELRGIALEIGKRTQLGSRLAGAVLGHLNTVVRLLAGAVEQAGLYTKHGVPQVANRIGVMEAVG